MRPLIRDVVNTREFTLSGGRSASLAIIRPEASIACEPPMQPYGPDNSHDSRPIAALRGPNSSLEAIGVKETPPVISRSQTEDISLTMVSRGDKI